MKSLTAPAILRTQRQDAAPIYLLQIDFTAPSAKTLYLSDRYVTALSHDYLGLVKDWGTLEEALNTLDPDGKPATAEITLNNTSAIEGRTRFSDLIRTRFNITGAYEWAFAKVTVTQLFEGLGSSDSIQLGVFYLEDPTDIGEDVLTVRMTDQSLVIENSMRNTVISRDILPYVSSAIVGESIPVVIGTVPSVPTLPAVAGAATTLNGSLTAVATTVTVVDTSLFDATGTIQVDGEQISYTGKTATTFTGCTRAANTTVAIAHNDQATVLAILAAYTFIVAEHDASYKTKAISNIRVNGRPAVTSPSTTLDNTALMAGKRVASITFTPSSVGPFHSIPFSPWSIAVSSMFATVPAGGDASDTKTITLPTCERLGDPHTCAASFTITVGGASPAAVGWNVQRKVNGAYVILAVGLGVNGAGSDSQRFVTLADDEWLLQVHLPAATAGNATVAFTSYTVTVDHGSTTSMAEAVIGDVTCDVQGIQDDGSGTISGTPTLLLENPTDVTRFILGQLFGVTTFGTTWTASRASMATAGYKWGFVLDYMSFSALRRKLGEQARSVLFIEGGNWEYSFLATVPATQLTLDYTRDVWDGLPARVSRTTRTDVRNSLTVSSQIMPSTGTYARVRTVQDLTQPGFATAIPDTLNLDLVQDATTADALAAYWLAWRKRQHFAVDLVAWWNLLSLDKIDYVAIASHPVLTASGGGALVLENGTGDITIEAGGHLLIEDLVFRVVGKSYLVGDENPGRIRLRLVEV